jgi:hypothetical protein
MRIKGLSETRNLRVARIVRGATLFAASSFLVGLPAWRVEKAIEEVLVCFGADFGPADTLSDPGTRFVAAWGL